MSLLSSVNYRIVKITEGRRVWYEVQVQTTTYSGAAASDGAWKLAKGVPTKGFETVQDARDLVTLLKRAERIEEVVE